MNKPMLCLLAMILAVVPAVRLSAEAPAVGQFLDVVGRVEVQRAGQPARKGILLFPLHKGDVVRVREGGAEAVLFESGARWALAARSAVRVQIASLQLLFGPRPRRLPPLGHTAGPISHLPGKPVPPRIQRILGLLDRGQQDSPLGPSHPSPDGAVVGAPVTLHWSGPVMGAHAQLQISDGERAVHTAELPPTQHEYTVPDLVLRSDEWYLWSVTAVQAGGERDRRCVALLRVFLPEERAEVERLQSAVQQAQAAEAENQDHRTTAAAAVSPLLLLAQTEERFGLFAEARADYEAVLRLRPGDPGVEARLAALARERGRR